MSQNFRLNTGGLINRDKPIEFKFNGKKYIGYEGDTLASALLANGIHLIGRALNIIVREDFLVQELMNQMQKCKLRLMVAQNQILTLSLIHI